MGTAKVSFNKELDKENVHMHNGILLGHRKDEILPLVTVWMDLGNIMLMK